MYNVLWIDDQFSHPEMVDFTIEAENKGFNLEGYTSFEEGFEVLERNIHHFDLILLDGLFFEKKGQIIGTEDESGIGMAIAKINELKNKKYFPWFVLSGKDKFTKGENSLLKANKAQCFDKTNPSDVVRLFEEMIKAGSEQAEIQLKLKYADVLAVCSDHLLGIELYNSLFLLVKQIEEIEIINNTEDQLISIRKIIERMLTYMMSIGIIPEDIGRNQGWINKSSSFLSNKHTGYEHVSEITPPLVGESIYRLLNVVQDGSHASGDLKLRVDEYLKKCNNKYLYKSCIYLLFDLLVWFKDFVENNKEMEINKSKWKKKTNDGSWISGTIVQISENGYGSFKPNNERNTISVPPPLVQKHTLRAEDKIEVVLMPSPDGTKNHIKELKKVTNS